MAITSVIQASPWRDVTRSGKAGSGGNLACPGPWPKQQGITPEALLYGRSYVVINGRTPYLARSWARARASRLIDIG
jgi:hypothetical protein